MKKAIAAILFLLSLMSCNNRNPESTTANSARQGALPDTAEMTNNFYDNTETFSLPVGTVSVEGEIGNPGIADLSSLPLRSVIVKEALPDGKGGDTFIGAYRYDGYSLFDILEKTILKKANAEEFKPIIDLYVVVENAAGDKAVFSWGEIFYPVNLHRIIIATGVSRIVPSKTKDLWPLPSSSRIVAANDLLTSRNISDPARITVMSVGKSYPVTQGLSPMYSASFGVYDNDKLLADLSPATGTAATYRTVFYGRGRGIHSTTPFEGILLRDVLLAYYPADETLLRTGLLSIAGKDGYRCAVSYSELFNRNDQQEMLLVRGDENEDGGRYRIFAAADFFSDRAIKSLARIDLLKAD